MERVPATNEAASGNSQDMSGRAMEGTRLGSYGGRQVSESPPVTRTRRGQGHDTGGGVADAQRSLWSGQPTRPPPPIPAPRPKPIADRACVQPSTGAGLKPGQPSPPPLPERTYANVSSYANLRPRPVPGVESTPVSEAGIEPVTRAPVAAPRLSTRSLPPTTAQPLRPPSSLSPPGGGNEAVRRAQVPQAIVQPVRQERTYANVGASARTDHEHIYEQIPPPQSTARQDARRALVTPAPRQGSAANAAVDVPGTPEIPGQMDATAQTYTELALARLEAAGVEDPEFQLVRLYRRHVRNKTHFDEQVQSAAERFQKEKQHDVYTLAAFDVADGDKFLFHQLMRPDTTEDQRRRLGDMPYARYSAAIKPFVGPTAKEYLRSFDDQPVAIHARVARDAANLARSPAEWQRAGAQPIPPDATRV